MPLYNINMVTRSQWGARPPASYIPAFEPPALHVILTMKTDFGECFTKEECSEKVRAIQKLHMDEWGLPDIAYSFLIGHDGNIYEGRGWSFRAQKAINNPDFDNKTYDIGLLGDYSDDVPEQVYYMGTSLLTYAVQYKYLKSGYTYVGHVHDEDPNIPKVDPKDYIKSRIVKTVILPNSDAE